MVNNGADIALWVDSEAPIRGGLVADNVATTSKNFTASLEVSKTSGIGRIATSGWRGRSHSLGVADGVTVVAVNAATADAAATLIANAVNVSSTHITRRPASEIFPDSDLGSRLVTVNVARLSGSEKKSALDWGLNLAEEMMRQQIILGAILVLQGDSLATWNLGTDLQICPPTHLLD